MHRDRYWDFIKGLCIIGVICIHTTGMKSIGGVLFRQLLIPSVALFFFIAGYYCHSKMAYFPFVIGKIKRIAVPWFIWSLIYGGVDLYFRRNMGILMSASDLLRTFFSYSCGFGYFLVAIFQCYLLAPTLMKVNRRTRLAVGMMSEGVSIMALYAYYWINDGAHVISTVIPMMCASSWLLFFVGGLNAAEEARCSRKGICQLLLLLFSSYFCANAAALMCYVCGIYKLGMEQIRLTAVCFSFTLACTLYEIYRWHGKRLETAIMNSRLLRPVVVLGEMSMFVYLSHRLIILLLRGRIAFSDEVTRVCMLALAVVMAEFVLVGLLRPVNKRKLWWVGL